MKGSLISAMLMASIPMLAMGACPNSCSGKGTCGTNDQCSCYQGYRGNACEQRICPFGRAWTTTPQGDLNFDGDRWDASQYTKDQIFTSRSHVVQPQSGGGTWEIFPSYAVSDEGHFSMECSNAGLCNKDTGECQCFRGFEGHNCERSSCPGGNDCNGHGRCMTVNQLVAEAGGVTYANWDGDMMRVCSCDPGYEGIGCTDRKCPLGDDPLTKSYQIDDHQTIEIWSTVTTNTGANLDGTFTLTYKDLFGQQYTTDAIDVVGYTGSSASIAVATDVENALKALPNRIIPDVSVTAGFCDKTVKGDFTAAFAADSTATSHADGEFFRCPTYAKSGTACGNAIWMYHSSTPKYWSSNDAAFNHVDCGQFDDGTAVTYDAAASGCTIIQYPKCIRLRVKFTSESNTGSLNLLTVDHSGVTENGLTNAASNNAAGISSSVSKTPLLNSDGSHGYVAASAITVTFKQDSAGVATNTITYPASAGFTAGENAILPGGAKIQIYCQGASESAYTNMGEYTISVNEVADQSGTSALTSNINDPSGRCTGGGTSALVKLQLLTNYISSDVDYTNTDIVSGAYGVTIATTDITSTVASATYTSPTGYLLLSEVPSAGAISSGAATLKVQGAGTKESDECSGRGECDQRTGLCDCYSGYTGERCSSQNALWVGSN